MPRTLDPAAHRLRKEAFLDVAQTLIQTKGYEEMSLQDVLTSLSASKGAFYHYFDSKQGLLDGVVERFADDALARIRPIVDDPALPALRKLEQTFRGIAVYKAERVELVLAIIAVWNSDGNALVRERMRRLAHDRLGPVLTQLVRQGADEGVMSVPGAPEDTARVVIYLLQGFQDLATDLFLKSHQGLTTIDEVIRKLTGVTVAIERVLGIAPGSVTLIDESTIRFWFESPIHMKEAHR